MAVICLCPIVILLPLPLLVPMLATYCFHLFGKHVSKSIVLWFISHYIMHLSLSKGIHFCLLKLNFELGYSQKWNSFRWISGCYCLRRNEVALGIPWNIEKRPSRHKRGGLSNR